MTIQTFGPSVRGRSDVGALNAMYKHHVWLGGKFVEVPFEPLSKDVGLSCSWNTERGEPGTMLCVRVMPHLVYWVIGSR